MKAAWGLRSKEMEDPGGGGVWASVEPVKLIFLAPSDGVWDRNWVWVRDRGVCERGARFGDYGR